MTKFEELCNVYWEARKRFFDYKRDCIAFANKLFDDLIQYLKCPKECVKFIPLKGEYDPKMTYLAAGAMRLEDDGFWQLVILQEKGLILLLEKLKRLHSYSKLEKFVNSTEFLLKK